MPLIDDVRKVADQLVPSELPTNAEVQKTVGALVKILETAGLTVADELLSPPVVKAIEPEANQAAAAVTADASSRLDRLEALLEKALGREAPAPAAADPQPQATGTFIGR